MASIFFSFASSDKEFAQGLGQALESLGHSVWIGTNDLLWGDNFIDRTQDALRNADAVVFLLSEESYRSSWLSFELGAASAQGKKIYPILLSLKPEKVPMPIAQFQLIRATVGEPKETANRIHRSLAGEV